jgi:uncharacterized Zn finger protein
MPHESAEDKALRYLASARIRLVLVNDRTVRGIARGSDRFYRFGWDPPDSWFCTCPARSDKCCHLRGAQLVCTAPLPQAGQPRA